jgi:sulfate permease, SulP family
MADGTAKGTRGTGRPSGGKAPTRRAWPVLAWVPGYRLGWLRLDLIAGLTVCGILVPEGMAYAQLAGVPPEFAFYAAPIGLLAYAVIGSSRQVVVAVSSAVAIMSAATISELATPNSAEYIALTAALAILAGLVSIAFGALRLGRIAQFFSESVLTGFVFGLALLITIKQIPKILGVEAHGDTAAALVRDLLPHLKETDLLTLAVGAAGIAAMIVLERRLPKLPAALVVLAGSIVASVAFGFEASGVKVVGVLPAGLAGPSLPGVGLGAVPQLIGGALGIALVAFAEEIGPANQFAREHGGKVDPNRELIALGAANAGAGLFSGFPIGSSLSKSAANDRAGAKTPASLVTAAAATALVALFLTPLFEPLPEATLGAIVIVAVAGMMKVGKMRELWRLRRAEFILAMIALSGVLVMPTLPALLIAVIASLGVLVWRTSQARLTFLGRARGGLEPVDVRTAPDAMIPGLLVVRPDEMLFFANVATVRDELVRAVEEASSPVNVVLLDLELTPSVDAPVVDALKDLNERLRGRGVELWLCHLQPDAQELLDRGGVLAAIGPERIHPREIAGVLAYSLRAPGSEERAILISDLLGFIRERAARPGTSQENEELLAVLDERLSAELAAARGAGVPAPPPAAEEEATAPH